MALSMPKKIIYASFAACGLVGLAAILDLIIGMPFGGSVVFDVLFLLSAAVIVYLGYDSLSEMA
ncbi:hypothetical protein Spb1_04080 [Planctopirus ephydatiae]|jgi:hypothetical protein|uniref:Uncharacterized protein n=2 Tax=Planctopirus ephydatiae TaxID=2528019 RepID=A0A518GIX4_9PLAN|nr:hypothetical protein Spb1_04080 [Planctopirus ephydatiae]